MRESRECGQAGEETVKPLCIDLFCGLGGWSEGFLAEGYACIGFDIERHDYGTGGYPGQLVLQDVLTLHGSQFKDAAVIVASPPCQFFSYCAMPWTRAKLLGAVTRLCQLRLEKELALFNACLRIGKEANVPMIIENVRGAQPWVGEAKWNSGPFFIWGDIPALMPILKPRKGTGGSWFGLNWRGRGDPGSLVTSSSPLRKKIAAERAKIPIELARHIAKCFKPIFP